MDSSEFPHYDRNKQDPAVPGIHYTLLFLRLCHLHLHEHNAVHTVSSIPKNLQILLRARAEFSFFHKITETFKMNTSKNNRRKENVGKLFLTEIFLFGSQNECRCNL